MKPQAIRDAPDRRPPTVRPPALPLAKALPGLPRSAHPVPPPSGWRGCRWPRPGRGRGRARARHRRRGRGGKAGWESACRRPRLPAPAPPDGMGRNSIPRESRAVRAGPVLCPPRSRTRLFPWRDAGERWRRAVLIGRTRQAAAAPRLFGPPGRDILDRRPVPDRASGRAAVRSPAPRGAARRTVVTPAGRARPILRLAGAMGRGDRRLCRNDAGRVFAVCPAWLRRLDSNQRPAD
ncbi:MAG: hypothetical protein KatS3mg118_3526 [Paracoccaceae bacterium]|nr:MAG: hypothetical protein KatS3mg118_3526 [Paracoccaceae bacterium]